jgi:hypothetical protein
MEWNRVVFACALARRRRRDRRGACLDGLRPQGPQLWLYLTAASGLQGVKLGTTWVELKHTVRFGRRHPLGGSPLVKGRQGAGSSGTAHDPRIT